jgi:hypothetical protein
MAFSRTARSLSLSNGSLSLSNGSLSLSNGSLSITARSLQTGSLQRYLVDGDGVEAVALRARLDSLGPHQHQREAVLLAHLEREPLIEPLIEPLSISVKRCFWLARATVD